MPGYGDPMTIAARTPLIAVVASLLAITPLTGCTPPGDTPPAGQATAREDGGEQIPAEHRAALKKAQFYANDMHMSKAGVYDQLVSEHGEKFPEDAARYAVDNVEADWNANALAKARTYQEMGMSNDAIRDQLVNEHGEKFTQAEADYAIENL